MTFGEFCDSAKATVHEREKLAYRLAAYRMEATLRALLPIPVKFNPNPTEHHK